jgi:hypothetical protein
VATERQILTVIVRHPELRAGLAEHADEAVRIARRIVEADAAQPRPAPDLPPDATAWERTYWAGRLDRDGEARRFCEPHGKPTTIARRSHGFVVLACGCRLRTERAARRVRRVLEQSLIDDGEESAPR